MSSARLKEIPTVGRPLMWLTVRGPTVSVGFDDFGKGDEGACRGADVEFGEDAWGRCRIGERFDEDVVLVDIGVDLGDFVIGIGVLEKIFDRGGVDVVIGGFVAEDMEMPLGLVDREDRWKLE